MGDVKTVPIRSGAGCSGCRKKERAGKKEGEKLNARACVVRRRGRRASKRLGRHATCRRRAEDEKKKEDPPLVLTPTKTAWSRKKNNNWGKKGMKKEKEASSSWSKEEWWRQVAKKKKEADRSLTQKGEGLSVGDTTNPLVGTTYGRSAQADKGQQAISSPWQRKQRKTAKEHYPGTKEITARPATCEGAKKRRGETIPKILITEHGTGRAVEGDPVTTQVERGKKKKKNFTKPKNDRPWPKGGQ